MARATNPTPAERSLRGRIAALSSWATTEDRSARTAPARASFDQRFYDQVDPDRKLSRVEREQRADAARRAYFARLALKSAKARRQRGSEEALDAAS